jgi:hypothetical protein
MHVTVWSKLLKVTHSFLDLEPRLRCRECDAKGKVVVSTRWGGSNASVYLP